MTRITDEQMQAALMQTRDYTVVLLEDDSPLCGLGIFTGTPGEVGRLMDEDPGVRAGVFTYRIHPSRSFPGDTLPA